VWGGIGFFLLIGMFCLAVWIALWKDILPIVVIVLRSRNPLERLVAIYDKAACKTIANSSEAAPHEIGKKIREPERISREQEKRDWVFTRLLPLCFAPMAVYFTVTGIIGFVGNAIRMDLLLTLWYVFRLVLVVVVSLWVVRLWIKASAARTVSVVLSPGALIIGNPSKLAISTDRTRSIRIHLAQVICRKVEYSYVEKTRGRSLGEESARFETSTLLGRKWGQVSHRLDGRTKPLDPVDRESDLALVVEFDIPEGAPAAGSSALYDIEWGLQLSGIITTPMFGSLHFQWFYPFPQSETPRRA